MAHPRDMRQHIAPDIGGGRVAVQEEHCGPVWRAQLPIGHGGSEHGLLPQGDIAGHGDSRKTVLKAMVLNLSSAAGLRSTFIRRMAPSQEVSRNSASSSGGKRSLISPAVWASRIQAANGAR